MNTPILTCATCRHAQHPLPADWWTENFQDERILVEGVVEDLVFRTGCTAVPDQDKPCLDSTPGAVPMTLTGRQKIGRQATYQAEAMLRALLTAAHHGDVEDLRHLVQATLPRLLELNSVSMSAHNGGSDTVKGMRLALHGGYEHLTMAEKGGAV